MLLFLGLQLLLLIASVLPFAGISERFINFSIFCFDIFQSEIYFKEKLSI